VIHSSHTSHIASSRPQNINLGTTSYYSKGVPVAALLCSLMAPYGSVAATENQTELMNLIFFKLGEDIAGCGIFQSALYFALKLRLYCFHIVESLKRVERSS
jgi:hypothetical protein